MGPAAAGDDLVDGRPDVVALQDQAARFAHRVDLPFRDRPCDDLSDALRAIAARGVDLVKGTLGEVVREVRAAPVDGHRPGQPAVQYFFGEVVLLPGIL